MLHIGMSAVLTMFLLSVNVALSAHSPTAWTQGHYRVSELSDDDVVAYWAFDDEEKDGLVVSEDGSIRGHVLVEQPIAAARAGVMTLGPGKNGKALFSATATGKDRACRSASEDFNLKHAFTVEMWFKLERGQWAKTKGRHLALFCLDDYCLGGQTVAAMGQLVQIPDGPPNTFYLMFQTRVDDKPRSAGRDVFSRHKVVLPGGKWHHVAFTWDGEKMRTYLDGKCVAEEKQTKGELLDAAEIRVGSHFWASGFRGSIDSVRVLDRAIAFAEPGKQPTVQPRGVRNPIAATTVRTPEEPTNVNVILSAHSPTAWTQGHYRVSELSDDDVVAYWAFDDEEKDGLVVSEDGSIRGHVLVEQPITAARVGVMTLGPGKNGKALFSATATGKDRACRSASEDFNLKRAFTVEMWFKLERGQWAKTKGRHLALFCLDDYCLGGQTVAAMGQLVQIPDGPPNTFYLMFQTRVDDKPRSAGRDVFSRHKVVLPGGKWHHVAFTWDGEKMRTYLDGKCVAEEKQTKGELLDAAEIRVGSHFWASGFRGSIDSVRVLDRAIAFAEPGKQPTVQPRGVRNPIAATTARTPEEPTKKRVGVRTGDLEMRFLEPHYRNNIYAGQKLDNVVVEIHSALPHPVELSFGPKGGKATFTRRIKSAIEPVTVKMPAKDLAKGKHEVTGRLVTAGGDVVFSKTVTLRKLPANPNTVRLRDDGIWLRRGKPYMPIGYFGLSVRAKSPTIAKLARTQGVNAGLSYLHWPGSDGDIRRLLDEAAKHNVSMLIIPYSNKGRLGAQDLKMSDAVRTQVSQRVSLFKDHPGLLGWYMADEPELTGETASWLRDMYELIRELDPYHPCIVLNDTLPGIARYAEGADVSMPDPYIVPLKVGSPNSSMTKIAAFMDAVRRTGKPAWITPESFNYRSHTPIQFMARAPNYTEQRCIAFLAMVHGARGYVYFTLAHCLAEPELRIGMPHVMRELTFVSKLLTSKGNDLPVTTRKPITAFARRADGVFMLVAVNPSRRPVEATLSCEGLPAELHALSEDRAVRASDGKISDHFEPYGVHIYTTAAGADRLATVVTVKEEVVAYKKRLAEENTGNLAFVGNGGKVLQASTYSQSMYLNDGTANHPTWRDGPRPGRPAWAEVTLAKARPVNRIVVDGTLFSLVSEHPFHDARVLLRVGGQWKEVGSVKDNRKKTVFNFKFPPITTDAVRVEITEPQATVVLSEIRVFGPSEK